MSATSVNPLSSYKPNIVVLDGYTLNPGDNPWDDVAALGSLKVYDRTSPGELLERSGDADIILLNKTPFSAATIKSLPKLRYVSVLATGYNVVDTGAARERGISVSNVPAYGTNSVAQHAVALLLELCNRVGLHDQAVRAGEWSRGADFCLLKHPVFELAGKTLGIIGYGRIGQKVAAIAVALGMEVMYFQRDSSQWDRPGARGVSLDELAAKADVISLHCAQTPENKEFVNASFLRKLKPGALLINTSRGALINEKELAEALGAGILAGAALDVVSHEPPSESNPLLGLENCIITPHIAWMGSDARRVLMRVTADNICGFLSGSLINVIN